MSTTVLAGSDALTLDQTIRRLETSDEVDGLAHFGSRVEIMSNSVSDYDLLVLVTEQPVDIFQLLTHIGGRMADVVISDIDSADRVLALDGTVAAISPEGMLIQKLWDSDIVYDQSGRLHRVQEHVRSRASLSSWLIFATESEKYANWFWQNHTLLHVKRMALSDDPLYASAADLMMIAGLAQVTRSYFASRDLLWQGEKHALRYVQGHDLHYLHLLRACIAETERDKKVALFEQLVERAIEPTGELWQSGTAAVCLRDPQLQPAKAGEALAFWEGLLMPHAD